MSRVLVVSSYPPRHCGIGGYAAAQVQRWRAAGEEVTVLSPPDGRGDLRVPFLGGRPFFRAARVGRRFDRVVVHFQPSLYYRPRAPVSKIATSLGLLWLCLRRTTEIVVHEADPPRRWRPDYVLLGLAFRKASTLLLHTERERGQLERNYRIRVRARLVPPTDGVAAQPPASRTDARRDLGLPADRTILVCPGFLHPDKGIERAIGAFDGKALLYVVGSVKEDHLDAYVQELRTMAASAPGVELVERFLDDPEFDAWIMAADAVVLPYVRSWSSAVLARARVIGTPAIVSDVGGLAEQASPADTVVTNDSELADAMQRVEREVAR